jgi:hypothetical protein
MFIVNPNTGVAGCPPDDMQYGPAFQQQDHTDTAPTGLFPY